MLRKELMADYVRSISQRLHSTTPFSNTCLIAIEDNLEATKVTDAIACILGENPNSSYTPLLNKIVGITDEDNNLELDNPLHYKEGTADKAHQMLLKPLVYHKKNECLVITTELLYNRCKENEVADEVFIAVENIFMAVKDDAARLDSFLGCIEHKREFGYIVLTNNVAYDAWNLYGFACLCHINEGSFAIPTELDYPSGTKFHDAAINYDAAVPYVQFFDVYNVMNESKHTQDILGRFLRMYQVLEYFAFRVHLVTIANDSARNSAFVRSVIRVANKASTKEEDEFLKAFKILFPSITAANKLDQVSITPYAAFLENNYSIKPGDQHCVNKVGRIIYQLRNSIVHNKATELHFTYGNIDEYRDGIDLLKKVTKIMEVEIVNLINDPNRLELRFANDSMPLY